MYKSPSDNPVPIGSFLPEKKIEEVAKVSYNRFDYTYGLRPSWVDNERVRQMKIMETKKVLDALAISGYKVVPMTDEEVRFPRK